MKSILITGANGFVGSHLVEAALKHRFDVWAGIRATSDKTYLKELPIHSISLDYGNQDKLNEQIRQHASTIGRWDYVIHCAGLTKAVHEQDFFRVNTTYTVHLAEALQATGNTPDKFLFMSSLSAYGPVDELTCRPIRNEDEPCPNTAYGRSKLEAERQLLTMKSFPVLILRPTGIYGPRDKDYFSVISMVDKGLSVSLGSKPQHLSFIYVKDLAELCLLALESPYTGKGWHVSDGDVYLSPEFVQLVAQCLGRRHTLKVTVPLWLVWLVAQAGGFVSRMSGRSVLLNPDKYRILKQRNWSCEAAPLQADLGFGPAYRLENGLKETIEWYRQKGWLK
jgi:nucleoside-diphosphate-sugar epimerase